MNEKEIVEMIYDTLMSQQFVNWYDSKFTDHVHSDEEVSKSQIEEDIKWIFNIK